MQERGNKLVIFDCDGTLVDGQHMIVDAMNLTFEREGLITPSRNAIRSIIGLSLAEAMAQLLPDADMAFHDKMAEDFKRAFVDVRHIKNEPTEPLYEGALDALKELDRAGYLLAVATGKSLRGLRRVLASHDLGDIFISLQTADSHPSKPHPSMVHTALADAGAAPEDTVVIGDTSYDMLMAKAARTGAIGVAWGYHGDDELKQSGAQHVAREYSDIPALVCDMIGS